jgi:hypothetical protein
MACESHTESGSRIEHDSVTLHPQNITTPVHGKCKHLECMSPTTAHIKAPPPHLLHLQLLSHNKLSTRIENIDKEKA